MENIAREEVRELCSRIRSCRTDSQLTVAQVKYGSAPSHTRSGSFLGETEIHIILLVLCTACSITSRKEGSRVSVFALHDYACRVLYVRAGPRCTTKQWRCAETCNIVFYASFVDRSCRVTHIRSGHNIWYTPMIGRTSYRVRSGWEFTRAALRRVR